MSIIQTTIPKIEFLDIDGNVVYTLSGSISKNSNESQGLLSYNFSRSVNNFSSSFSVTIKEDYNKDIVFDSITPLNIIKIYENGSSLDYIGIVMNMSFSATAQGFNKTVQISGRGIEYIFEYLTISLDSTAMAYTGNYLNEEGENINFLTKLNDKEDGSKTYEPVPIGEAFTNIYKKFKSAGVDKASKLTNVDMFKIVDNYYGDNFISCESNLKFQFPISNQLFTNNVVNLYSYWRTLLPDAAYEIFSVIENDKPKITVREKPFDLEEDSDKYMNGAWGKLKSTQIKALYLVSYNLNLSIDEIYTVFFSYVQGSAMDPNFYQKKDATSYGYNSVIASDKVKKYGYKPLTINFVGYNRKANDKNSQNDSKDALEDAMKKLNERVKNWYENMDQMYYASLRIVRPNKDEYAKIGEKINFLDGEFYITDETHSWNYGSSPMIDFQCDRGGKYENNKFSQLKNTTIEYAELEFSEKIGDEF